MPELPDIELYRAALAERVLGRTLVRIRVAGPAWPEASPKKRASLHLVRGEAALAAAARLHRATRALLEEWSRRLVEEPGARTAATDAGPS